MQYKRMSYLNSLFMIHNLWSKIAVLRAIDRKMIRIGPTVDPDMNHSCAVSWDAWVHNGMTQHADHNNILELDSFLCRFQI